MRPVRTRVPRRWGLPLPPADSRPTRTAIRTLMNILVDKGHLRVRKAGRENVYLPTRPRGQAGRSALRRVLATFFDGSVEKALAAHLAYVLLQPLPLDQAAGSLLFLALILAIFYFYGSIHHGRLAWGLFVLPLVLGLLYAPSFAALLSSEAYGGMTYWPLWALPWLLIVGGYCYLRYWGTGEAAVHAAKLQRADRYARALKQIGRETSHEFCKRLTFVTLIASLVFALCLPVLLTDFYRATFKFFCVVYGFLLVVHLVRISIAQNISIARADN